MFKAKLWLGMWLLATWASVNTLPMFLSDVHAQQPSAETQQLGKRLIEEGVKAYESGQYSDAIAKLGQARSLLPARSSIALYLGLAHLQQNNIGEAVKVWKEYLELHPVAGEDPQGKLEEIKTLMPQYLTLLVREENRRTAQALVAGEREKGPADPTTVAVTYYRNLGSTNFAPLQKGLTALLITDLTQVKDLKVVERDLLQALIEEMQLRGTDPLTEKNAPQVGRFLGAGKIATGSFLDVDKQQVRLDSVVAETSTAQVLGAQEASGQIPQFHEVEKTLALSILKDLGYDEQRLRAGGLWEKIRTPQTVSLAAFTAFSAGLEAKDKGDFAAARLHFEKALQEDPNFQEARKELNALPATAMGLSSIVAAVSGSASTAAATAGLATAIAVVPVVTTTTAIVGIGIVAGGIGTGIAVSSGGGNGNEAKCANSKLESGEVCDPPGQRAQCGTQQVCATDCKSCVPACNNGILNEGEACDPPGQQAQCPTNQLCANDCSKCEPIIFCGNQTIDPGQGEECDGSNLGGATCESLGFGPGGQLQCFALGDPQACHYDTSACNSCGNANIDRNKNEQCDGTNLDGKTCESLGFAPGGTLTCISPGSAQQCQFDTSACEACGNGVIDTSRNERCDPQATPTGCDATQLCIATGTEACKTCCDWEVSIASCTAEPLTAGVIDVTVNAMIVNGCPVPLTISQTVVSTTGDGQCSANGPGSTADMGTTNILIGPVALECFPTSLTITLEVKTNRGTKTARVDCL